MLNSIVLNLIWANSFGANLGWCESFIGANAIRPYGNIIHRIVIGLNLIAINAIVANVIVANAIGGECDSPLRGI